MNLRERVWIGLSLLSAAGILLHLGGSAWSWSPPLWQLGVFLIILLAIGWGGREADDGHGARRWQKWLSALRENPFGAALLLLAAVGTAVRMLSLDSGLVPEKETGALSRTTRFVNQPEPAWQRRGVPRMRGSPVR